MDSSNNSHWTRFALSPSEHPVLRESNKTFKFIDITDEMCRARTEQTLLTSFASLPT